MKKEHARLWIGCVLLLVASAIWGFAFSAQKIAGENLPPFSVNLFRFTIGALVLLPFVPISDRMRGDVRRNRAGKRRSLLAWNRSEWVGGILCGLCLSLASNLQQYCLKTSYPGKTAFLTALYVIFVPFFGLIRRKRVAPMVWVSVLVATAGGYLLTMYGEQSTGISGIDLIMLLCSVIFALHITVIDIFSDRVDGVRLSIAQFATAALTSLPLTLIFERFSFETFRAALPALLFLGMLSCGVGYTLQIVGQQILGKPTVASLILCLESVFGAVGGVLTYPEESLTGWQILGCCTILLATVIAQLPFERWFSRLFRKKQPKEMPASGSHPDDPSGSAGT